MLRTHGREPEADGVIHEALSQGVDYFDSARAYAGSEAYYGRTWRARPEARAKVFITSKSASRDAEGARRDLERTLTNLGVDSIDLWQIHDVRSDDELRAIARKGGALEAFLRAKEQGKVKHVGVTGHHDPDVLLRAVRELPVECVLLPINVAEGALGGFLDRVIPAAREKNMAVVGMKVLGQGVLLEAGFTADSLIRWALAQGADTLIVGCSTPSEVSSNVALATRSATNKMDEGEQRALLDRARPAAKRLAYYRRT